jgi:hypothetical protein
MTLTGCIRRLLVQFPDADCAARENVYDGGTADTAIHLQCLRDHTIQRIKYLDPMNWQGGQQIMGGGRERLVVRRRGRGKTACAGGA